MAKPRCAPWERDVRNPFSSGERQDVSLKFVDMTNRTDRAALFLMVFSFYCYLSLVMIGFNWGSGLPNAFAVVYLLGVQKIIPIFINRLGAEAAIFFLLFAASFLILNRRKPRTENLLETLRMGSVIMILFEFGLILTDWHDMGVWVIQAFVGTPLQAFTNWDLLILAVVVLVLSQSLLMRRSRTKPRPINFEEYGMRVTH
jgi:hypothetical protein